MIQRIQSIYLLLAGLLPAFTFFVPSARLSSGEVWLTVYSCHYDATQVAEMAGTHPWGLMVWSSVAILLSLWAIMGYKNRKKQARKTLWAVACQVLWFVALGAYTYAIASRTGFTPSVGVGCVFPLLSIVLLLLARRAICKDEALVRAADRIR